MNKVLVRAVLLALSMPLFLHASYTLKNDLLKVEAVEILEKIGIELQSKTGVSAYVIATHEHFPERYNLVEHVKKYDENMSKPYVLFIFAPYATITKKSEARGRVGIVPSSDNVRAMYDYDNVRDATINIVAIKDSNTLEDKYNIGILQGYSELADNIAASKDVTLEHTIPDELGTMVMILRVLVYSGTLILVWLFMLRPLYMKVKHGKK